MNKDYIYKRRLLKLANFLESLPRKRFDFRFFVGSDWEGKENLSCGTTACSLGWATTIPSFRRLGLSLVRDEYDHSGYVVLNHMNDEHYDCSFLAAKEVFGLDPVEYEFLFIPVTYHSVCTSQAFGRTGLDEKATPKQAAKHIKSFCKKKYGK